MPDAAHLVRTLHERYQARDWDAAGALLHPDAGLPMPGTAERLAGRDAVVASQCPVL